MMKELMINNLILRIRKYASTLAVMLVALLLPQASWAQWAETPKNTDGGDIAENAMKKIVNDGNITLVTAIGNISPNQYFFNYEGATSYSSSNTAVAWIGETASYVNIAGAGTATITATVGENTYSYTLIVNNLGFSSNPLEVVLGEQISLTDKVTVTPTPSETAPLEFSQTGATSVATIDNDALTLTGTKLGVWSDVLNVNFKNEGNYVPMTALPTCSLKVVPPAPTIVPATANVYTYDTYTTVTISMPEAITEGTLGGYSAIIKYKYNNGGEVSEELTYEAEGVGLESSCGLIAWIEVVDVNNNNTLITKSAETSANFVIRQNPLIQLSYSSVETRNITFGESLDAPIVSSEADQSWPPTVTWSSDKPAIATVDETTGVVTPVSASDETVIITATFAGNDTYSAATASYTIKVNKATNYFAIVEDEHEYSTTTIEATIGQPLSLSEAITLSCPAGLQLTWECNNKTAYNNGINDATVAEIDNSGNLTVLGYGVAIVKITANKDEVNANYAEADVEIDVFVKPQAPSITPDNGIYYLGQKITVTNADATSTDVKATIENIGNGYEGSPSVEYTPEVQSIYYGVKAYSSITRTIAETSSTYSRKSDEITRNYVFCNTPVISSGVNNGEIEVTISCEGIENLPGCQIMYNINEGEPIVYDVDNKPIISSASTLYAFIRYTNSDEPTEIYNSTPVSITFSNPDMSFAEETAEVTYGSTLNSPTLTKPENVRVTYSSSDETVATIDAESGLVTPLKVGTATITATSIPVGEYVSTTATYTLTVTAKAITDDMVTLSGFQNATDNSYTYSGILQKPTVTVTGLTEGTDYTVTNEGGTNKGTYSVIVTGQNNYKSAVTKEFKIHPLRLSSDSVIVNGVDPQTFTGAAIVPALSINYNGISITKDTHYTIGGNDNINVNTTGGAVPTLTLTAIDSETNNFYGTRTVTFNITQADLGYATIDDIEAVPYDGNEHMPTLTVKLNGNEISSEDYTVSYTKGETAVTELKDVGTYTVILTSSNKNFAEGSSVTKNFEISAATASITADNQEVTYNIDAEVYEYDMSKVTKSPTSLTEEDFSLTYYEEDPSSTAEDTEQIDGYPTSAGTYFVKIEITNPNYQMTPVVKTLTINPKVLTDEMITITPESTVYSGNLQTPTVTVMDGETSLGENNDYTVTNNGGTSANDYDVVVIGKGNYSGTITKTFSIRAKEVTGATVTLDGATDFVYDGTAKTPTVNKVAVTFEGATAEIVFNADTDYDVSYSEGRTDVGEYTVTVTFKGNYSGTAFTNFDITPKSISDESISITDIADQTYTGSAITPTITVKDGETTLVEGSDYTVEYSGDNINVTPDNSNTPPTVTIRGVNNYDPATSQPKTFKIVAAQATLSANNTEVTYNGEPQEISGVSATAGTAVVDYYETLADLVQGHELEVAPTNAGTYYVRVTQGNANYTSTPVNVTLTINQAEITDITLSQTELTYTGAEQTVNVTSVKAGNLDVASDYYMVSGNSGTTANTYTVTVTAKDTEGNNFKGSATATFTIKNRQLSAAGLFADGAQYASFYSSDEDFDLPESVAAYVITGVNGTSVTTKAMSFIPKNVPVLLEKITGSLTDGGTDATGNMLQYAEEYVEMPTSEGIVYVLYNNMYIRATGNKIPSGKCYLLVPTATINGARQLSISHNGDTTGIVAIEDGSDPDGDSWFDMQGRKVNRPAKKGLYIKNGQKVVIK